MSTGSAFGVDAGSHGHSAAGCLEGNAAAGAARAAVASRPAGSTAAGCGQTASPAAEDAAAAGPSGDAQRADIDKTESLKIYLAASTACATTAAGSACPACCPTVSPGSAIRSWG
jgi:hypothetical protein